MMTEVDRPWAHRGPFFFQEIHTIDGNSNHEIDTAFIPSIKHDFTSGGSGGNAMLNVGLVSTEAVSTDPYTYEYENTVHFEAHVKEGDEMHAPWVGVEVTLKAIKTTTIATIVDSYAVSYTIVSQEPIYYSYIFSESNYNPDPSDPNWTSPRDYVTPYTSMPVGPTYTAQKADLAVNEGEYWDTIDGTITYQSVTWSGPEQWTLHSVVDNDYEVG
jgi:hypothetical protein